MATQTKENYLKALYYLHQKSEIISVTDLGKMLQVSKPTASSMMKKLQAKGWVMHQKYKPLKITDTGLKAAAIIIRRHRLSEMFLSQIMGFGWEEVHDIAEEMEHLSSTILFDRMDEILGFPTRDPHGSPIPDKNGNFDPPNYKPLSHYKSGKFVLKALQESSSEFIKFLNNKKISLGTTIEITYLEEFDKSMIVSYSDQEDITLSDAVCSRLLVEEKG